MQRSGRLITPQNLVDDEAAFMQSYEYRAAELIIRNLHPMLQSIQNAQDLLLQVECGFLERADMKQRFQEFYQQVAEEIASQQAPPNGDEGEPEPTPEESE